MEPWPQGANFGCLQAGPTSRTVHRWCNCSWLLFAKGPWVTAVELSSCSLGASSLLLSGFSNPGCSNWGSPTSLNLNLSITMKHGHQRVHHPSLPSIHKTFTSSHLPSLFYSKLSSRGIHAQGAVKMDIFLLVNNCKNNFKKQLLKLTFFYKNIFMKGLHCR